MILMAVEPENNVLGAGEDPDGAVTGPPSVSRDQYFARLTGRKLEEARRQRFPTLAEMLRENPSGPATLSPVSEDQ